MPPWAADPTTNWCACSPQRPNAASAAAFVAWTARALLAQGAHRVIVGTSAFTKTGINENLLSALRDSVGRERLTIALDSKGGRIVVKGWQEATAFTAEEVLPSLEPYCSGFLCTYVDKEGMMQGTDLDWFRRLRAATTHEITAAGGITTL